MSSCMTLLTVSKELASTAVPMGLATDENNHAWVAVANNDGKGTVLEIDPETSNIISNIGRLFIRATYRAIIGLRNNNHRLLNTEINYLFEF